MNEVAKNTDPINGKTMNLNFAELRRGRTRSCGGSQDRNGHKHPEQAAGATVRGNRKSSPVSSAKFNIGKFTGDPMSKIIDCPRCNEGDDRPLGHNVCPACECRFWVRPNGTIFVPDPSKRISLQVDCATNAPLTT